MVSPLIDMLEVFWRASQSSIEAIPFCILVSSANDVALVLPESPLAMFLMWIRNRIGPNTVPWGTPEMTGD